MKKTLSVTMLTFLLTIISFAASASNDNCNDLISKFFISGQKTGDYKWATRPISDVQITKLEEFASLSNIPLKKGDTLHVLTYEDFGANNSVDNIFKQNIRENGLYENKLVKLSAVDQDPKVTFQVRAVLSNKVIFEYNIYQAEKLPVSLDKATTEFLVAMKDLPTAYGVEVKAVEINIVHPYYTVGVQSGKSVHVKSDAINEYEFEDAIELLKVLPKGVEVIVKAIVPNGFYYETVLKR